MRRLSYIFLMPILAAVAPAALTAQVPPGHAVLYVQPDPAGERALTDLISERGGRVAVRSGDAWVIRADAGLRELLERDSRVLRVVSAASAAESAFDRQLVTGESLTPADPAVQSPAEFCDTDVVEIDRATVDRMRKTADAPGKTQRGTSEVIPGSSAVAVFFVPPAWINSNKEWTEALQEQIHANVLLNLAWWSDRAADYGKDATFELVPFWFDDPVFDVELKQPAPGERRSWVDDLMEALGYEEGEAPDKMVAFLEDLRTERDTDWAFIAYITLDQEFLRSFASIGGPSTRVHYASARQGLVFAHEMGHIYGTWDEYEERAPYVRHIERFGVPNANADFRNHNSIPCIMKNNWGMCTYTAVHLGLADEAQHFSVTVDPPGGVFDVEYSTPDVGTYTASHRHQGATEFPWGRHMQVRLRAASDAFHNGVRYTSPVFDVSGGPAADLIIHGDSPANIHLQYSATNEAVETEWTYLRAGHEIAGRHVRDIVFSDDGTLGFATMHGISILLPDGRAEFVDPPLTFGRIDQWRESHGAAVWNGQLLFTSHFSEIVSWRDGEVEVLQWPGMRQNGAVAHRVSNEPLFRPRPITYSAVAFAPDGSVWAGSEIGLHRYHDGMFTEYAARNSGLISDAVTTLAATPDGQIWVGGGDARDREGPGFLQRFDPQSETWFTLTDSLPNARVARIRHIGGDTVAVGTFGGMAYFDGASWTRYDGEELRPWGVVHDVDFDAESRPVIGTPFGLGRREADGTWSSFTTENSLIPGNFVRTVRAMPGGELLVGTLQHGGAVMHPAGVPSSVPEAELPPSFVLHGNYPNPFNPETRIRFDLGEAGPVRLAVYDGLGRLVRVLADGEMPAGEHTLAFDGRRLASGVYFYRLHAGPSVQTRAMVLKR